MGIILGIFGELFGWIETLHGWKHLRAQIFEGEKLEGGNGGRRDWGFTKICLFSLSPFVFLSFNSFIFFKYVLVCFLRARM